ASSRFAALPGMARSVRWGRTMSGTSLGNVSRSIDQQIAGEEQQLAEQQRVQGGSGTRPAGPATPAAGGGGQGGGASPGAPLPTAARMPGKYLVLEVPNFNSAADPAAQMGSYLRLGSVPDPSIAGQPDAPPSTGEDLASYANVAHLDGHVT